MLTLERTRTIFKLAFPITVALSSTFTMTLVDLFMIRKLGNNATAALGLSAFSSGLVAASMTGILPAVQGVVARRRGEGSTEPRCLPLNAGMLIALLVGLPISIVCYLLAPAFFSVISPDPQVIRIGVPVLRTLYLSLVAVGINCAFKGYWAGMEKPRLYMSIVVGMQVINFVLDYTLISGRFGAPALGATGAAVATTVSAYAATIINLSLALFLLRKDGFLRAIPKPALLTRIMKLGLPVTMQDFLFAAGYVVFFWMVGRVGTSELAAANVLIRVTLGLIILATSLGMASATLVSKTVGEGDIAGAAEWGWDTGKLGVIVTTLLGIPIFVFPQFFLSIFLSNPHTIQMAVIPLRMVAVTTGFGSLIYIFGYVLNSVGDGHRVVMVGVGTQWLFFLPVVWIVGPYLHRSLLQIWLVQLTYGALVTTLIAAIWADGKWKRIRI
jgi:MATE family, multidrug efflux pump